MLLEATTSIATRVNGAIREAARLTGVGFEYLLKTAQRESALDPNAQASTSSAKGLFQFIDQTWLGTLKESGPNLGYGRYADAIAKTPSGGYAVTDPAMRDAVMNLRFDPAANALMAGALTQRNATDLADGIGRKPSDGELYMAHFLGASGATRLIGAATNMPNRSAAELFPDAARANRSIFYERTGQARSAAQVYDALAAKHTASMSEVAAAPAPASIPSAFAALADHNAAKAVKPGVAQSEDSFPPQTGPVFHGLFRTDSGAPLSSLVRDLWGEKKSPGVNTASVQSANRPLELFQFLRPDIKTGGGKPQA